MQHTYKHLTFDELTERQKICVHASMDATNRSYSPYSNFKVGAAALLSNGKIVIASNQENVSFGAGLCAERALVYSDDCIGEILETISISANKEGVFVDVSPCGICRQSLLEIEERQKKEIEIIFKYCDKFIVADSVQLLLPFSFTNF